jgi:uncharacterized protein YbaR (Trm112 family)
MICPECKQEIIGDLRVVCSTEATLSVCPHCNKTLVFTQPKGIWG